MKTTVPITSLLMLVLAVAPGPAQTPPQPAPDVPVFGAESAVVLLDVVVRDKKGKLVRDLTAQEFEVFEDGKRQHVDSFRVMDGGLDLLLNRREAPAAAPAAATASTAPEPAAEPEAPRGPSVIAFLYDRLSPQGRDNAHKAAKAYATRGHVDGDMVAVFMIDLALHTLQPFTADLPSIQAAFDRANMQAQTEFANHREQERSFFSDAERLERTLAGMNATMDTGAAAQAANLAVQREFALLQGGVLRSFDRLERDQQGFSQTNALMALVGGLKALPGRKTLVYFSEGIAISANVLPQFRSAIATANRANVTVYTVDVGGLRAISNTQDARDQLVARANERLAQEGRGYIGTEDRALTQGQERAEDMLRMNPKAGLGDLAEQTGGFLVADTNDTGRGFQRIQEEMRFHYLLSYNPTDPAFDGRFRSVSVKVSRPNVVVHSRNGYLAIKPNAGSVPVRTFEAPALAQLDRRPPPRDFPISATALSFPEPKRPGRVTVMVQVPASALAFEPEKDGRTHRASFSVVARLRDAQGRELDRMSRDYPLTVASDKLEAARQGDVLYFQETDLAPGQYRLEAVVWDDLAKKASVHSMPVEVPVAGEQQLRLSSLMLVQRVDKLSPSEQGRDNPLYFGETILYPNMGEPLRKSQRDTLGFFFNVYGLTADAPRQAVLELTQGGKTTARLPVSLPAPDATGRVRHAASLPMAALPPGEYGLRLTVSSGTQTASRQCPMVIAE